MKDSKLRELARLILLWPGLTAGPPEELIQDLIDDSLVLVDKIGDAARVVDVGSGAGLPGLPLKIAAPHLELVLIEADQAKSAFLVQACAALGLGGVEVLPRRAEDVGHDPLYRETFDLAVARAVAPMRVLVELCLPLVRVGGRLLAQKTAAEDVGAAQHAIEVLGGSPPTVVASPSSARARGTIVVVEKIAPTPKKYPRRAGIPARKPLA